MKNYILFFIFLLVYNEGMGKNIVFNDTIFKKIITYDSKGLPYYEKYFVNDSLITVNYIELSGKSRVVFFNVDELPSIVNENIPIYKFVNENAMWPSNNDGQGLVLISIIVEVDGGYTNVRIIKGINHAIDEAAINAVNQLPKLVPGKIKDIIIPTEVIIPLFYQW